MKRCSHCKEEKELDKFYKDKRQKDGLDNYCSKCKREAYKKHYKDPEKVEKHRLVIRGWNSNPKNREKMLSYHKTYSKKARSIPHKKLARNLGTYLYMSLTGIDPEKNFKKKTLKVLGLPSWEDVKKYIESTWLPGMNWDNWGVGVNNTTWHIDHKIPTSSAKTVNEVKKLFHYTNLRAYWGSDNIRKSNNLI